MSDQHPRQDPQTSKAQQNAAAMMSMWIGVGLAIGSVLGVALHNLALDLGVGIAIGAGSGGAYTVAQSKKP